MDCPWLGAQQQLSICDDVRWRGRIICAASGCWSVFILLFNFKALQMGMERDMEYAQGLSWTFRVPNGCKVADGGLQGLARVVCRFSPTGGLCNEFGNGSFGIRRTSLRIGSTPQIPWFRSCHRLEACFLRMSTARYLIIRYWQFRRQMVGKVGRMGPAGMFAVDGRRALPMPVHRSNEHISGEHLP